jgi:hypothetical protein
VKMKRIATILGIGFIALVAVFVLLAHLDLGPDPMMNDPEFAARFNQHMLEDCLKADRERIALYGEAKPTQDCLNRELIYAAKKASTPASK